MSNLMIFLKNSMILTCCSFLSLKKPNCGRFKVISAKNEPIILQFDSDTRHRKYDVRIEISKIEKEVKILEEMLNKLYLEGKTVNEVDFSHSDLVEEEVFTLANVLKKFGVKYLDISDTHIDLVSDNQKIDLTIDIKPQLEFSKKVIPHVSQTFNEIEEEFTENLEKVQEKGSLRN